MKKMSCPVCKCTLVEVDISSYLKQFKNKLDSFVIISPDEVFRCDNTKCSMHNNVVWTKNGEPIKSTDTRHRKNVLPTGAKMCTITMNAPRYSYKFKIGYLHITIKEKVITLATGKINLRIPVISCKWRNNRKWMRL